MNLKTKQLFKLVMASVLIALNIVLERLLTVQTESNHYNLSIITIVFAVVYLGMPYAIGIAALGDIIGALLFPVGAYFPGFTFTNIVTALTLALLLRKNVKILNTSLAVFINKIVGSLILNPLWISILYRGGIDAYPAYMVTRIPQAVIMLFVEIIVITLIFNDKSHIRKLLNKTVKKVI